MNMLKEYYLYFLLIRKSLIWNTPIRIYKIQRIFHNNTSRNMERMKTQKQVIFLPHIISLRILNIKLKHFKLTQGYNSIEKPIILLMKILSDIIMVNKKCYSTPLDHNYSPFSKDNVTQKSPKSLVKF